MLTQSGSSRDRPRLVALERVGSGWSAERIGLLHPDVNPELLVHVVEVVLHGLGTHEELRGGFAGGSALGEEQPDLELLSG